MAFFYIDQVHIFPFWCFIPKCLLFSPCSSSHSHFHDAPSPSFSYFSPWLFHSFPFTSFCILSDPWVLSPRSSFLLRSGLFFFFFSLSYHLPFFRCISFVSFVEINYMILLLANSTILPTSSQCCLAIFSFLRLSISALMLMHPVEMIPFETKVPYAIMSVVSQSFIWFLVFSVRVI